MKINKILFFGLLAAVVVIGTVGEVFSGSITITNELPSYVVNGKEQNVVSVEFRIHWPDPDNAMAKITNFIPAVAEQLHEVARDLRGIQGNNVTVYQSIDKKYNDRSSYVKMDINPGATQTWGKLGVWITNFYFNPSDIVIKGERGESDDYTGAEKWKNIKVEAHQSWKLWLKKPS